MCICRRTLVALALCGLGLAITTQVARADSYVYTYTGNDFTTVGAVSGTSLFTTTDSIMASVTLSAPLLNGTEQIVNQFLDFQFSDGVDSFDFGNSSPGGPQYTLDGSPTGEPEFTLLDLTTGPTGGIINWQVELIGGNLSPQLIICNQGPQILADQCGPSIEDDAYTGEGNGESYGVNSDSAGSWAETSIVTPEPSCAVLVGTGVIALVGFRKSRKKQRPE
jgi:hypothetical protein